MASNQHHVWKVGRNGRQLNSLPGGSFEARLSCTAPDCAETHLVPFRSLPPPEVIDRKFKVAGWSLDPSRCPQHSHKRKDKTVTTHSNTSPQAAKAQVQMVRLLSDHFDPDKGTYSTGWSDTKVAETVGLSPKVVTAFRDAGFGPLKEPEEIGKLAREIETFRGMVKDADEMLKLLQGELETLETRLADVRKRYS